jgi:hypothetical protein
MSESASPVRLPTSLRKLIYDEVDATTTYLGFAPPGAATNQDVWMIQRLTFNGPDITVEFADGNAEFDNVWNNRASLNYS